MSDPATQEILRAVTSQVKSTTEVLFEKYLVPRMERQLDLQMQRWLEQIVEKKIEERFAFAIELLRSLNPKVPDGKS